MLNAGLKEKAKDETSVMRQLEAARLKRESEQLRALVESIPPEIRQQLRQRDRKGKNYER